MPDHAACHQIQIDVREAEKILEPQDDNTGIHLLKALLKHAPTAEGILTIATDIIAASEQEDGLALLAMFYTTFTPAQWISGLAMAITLSVGSSLIRPVNGESKGADTTNYIPSVTGCGNQIHGGGHRCRSRICQKG